MSKPSLPQGTRDFSPDVVRKRQYIFQAIRSVFERHGFQPLETPALENLDTLLGKYGDEGDRLIFKVLNNGLDNPARREQVIADFDRVLEGRNSKGITERALRYDLTIPFARFVAMNHGQLSFPFKRYQIQPVWRADRPQKGRYREFYQCDADVVGSSSLWNEVELAHIYATAFRELGIPVDIRINHRKILAALAEACGGAELTTPITVAIDKLDKIGMDKVKDELRERGLDEGQVSRIEEYLEVGGDFSEQLGAMQQLLGHLPSAQQGIAELKDVHERFQGETWDRKGNSGLTLDFTLARGLNYYTGIIFEVKAIDVQIGSIGGGGRYDDLTGLFGVPDIPGVGISFGVDRIYDVMEERKLFPEGLERSTAVLFFNLGDAESRRAFTLMQALRGSGIASELYHEKAKFDKQFKYAEKKRIPVAVIIGETELAAGTCVVRNLTTGQQRTVAQDALLSDYQQHG
jgi:histidyl-tRNA synthetase